MMSPWLTKPEAIARLEVEPAVFERLIEAGELTKYGTTLRGGRYRVREVDALHHKLHTPKAAPQSQEGWARPLRPLHLYAIEIIGVGTKVGITDHPTKRLAAHQRTARDHGRKIGRQWVSVRHVEASLNERTLMVAFYRSGMSEYLRARFDAVMERAERLPMTRSTP